jgi:uncharacterized membrane protein YozB (DUF420 family)
VINYALLPAVNATLNATSGILLAIGSVLIKQRRIDAHRNCMLLAFASSTLFLISYVVYHVHIGSRPFPGTGLIRLVYFSILISHIILAIVILPMAIMTLTRGLRGQYARHRVIARRTFPLWMYVSVTGVIVYWMLYQLY